MTALLVLARIGHIGTCLMLFGAVFFERFVSGRIAIEPHLKKWLLAVILISGAAWLGFVSVTMGGTEAPAHLLKTVWLETHFGEVWQIRLAIWLVAAVAAALPSRLLAALEFVAASLLLASLGWAGHGQIGSAWHLAANAAHLLAAGIWPVGLFFLSIRIGQLRKEINSESSAAIAQLAWRFSAVSLAAVAALAATGIVNGWYLVGSFSGLIGGPYGRLLLAKIALFAGMLSIGAINRLRLIPNLLDHERTPEIQVAATSALLRNARLEFALGIGVICIVGLLGVLPPSA